MKSRVPLALAALLAAAVLLTGCVGASAKVTATATKVTLASSGGNPAEIAKSSEAHVGDVVKTNSAGRAELDYSDGSLTRLAPNTQVTVVRLDSASAQRTSVKVDAGRTWQRVKKLVADGAQYEVSTPLGVASVKGTAFEVDCTKGGGVACITTVIEGAVKFTTKKGKVLTVAPYQRLVVPNPNGGDPEVTVVPVDAIKADKWISENMAKDHVGDNVPAEAASMSGGWTYTATLTKVDPLLNLDTVGDVVNREWVFGKPDCSSACSYSVVSSSGNKFTVVLTKAGLIVTTDTPGGTSCTTDPPGTPSAWHVTSRGVLSRTVVGSSVTFSGKVTLHFVANDQYSGNCPFEPRDFDETEDAVLTR